MAEESYPFDTGPGADVNETVWRQMARGFGRSGMLSAVYSGEALVTPSGGPELIRAACPSGALVDGIFYRDASPLTMTVTPNGSSQPRRDSVILRLDPAANTITCLPKLGVPAAAPVPPVLTQVAGDVWEIGIADYTMPASGNPQNPYFVVDTRLWSDARLGCRLITSAAQSVPDGALIGVNNWEPAQDVGVFFEAASGNAIKVRSDAYAGLYLVGYRVQLSRSPTRASFVQVVVNDDRVYPTSAYTGSVIAGCHVRTLVGGNLLKLEALFSGLPSATNLVAGSEFYCWRLSR